MRKALLVPVLALTAFGLAGCGKKAPNEALEANELIGGDSNTMGEAVDDVNSAFANAEISYDNTTIPAGNTTVEEGSGDE
ncbi:hypothetical protein [Sphingomonas sp. G-3-2-10]|jgi:predicted small lipoprotein YifL|uniref:LptM family lipoprotein n=1 Tax=Sphingomonas sp. G-3-2-10 TaxID=2728838 RepID=UPI001469E850|nr:hypothetical protein [Sphingomonas sp. G-3-2-10]NML07517.1 hypothetical protein [Sphingomonas sp. G-3-2-10]